MLARSRLVLLTLRGTTLFLIFSTPASSASPPPPPQMKFPERVLRVKAESKADHERWYEAIRDARQKKLDGNNTPQAKQLENLKVRGWLEVFKLKGQGERANLNRMHKSKGAGWVGRG